MPRPRQKSKIQMPPRIKGLVPIGPGSKHAPIELLHLEEYEAIRLLDYEGIGQVEAAKIMGISRPTLTRIYLRARQKIAHVLTEGRQLIIEGGKAEFNGEWFECVNCKSKFNNPMEAKLDHCPLCSSENIKPFEEPE